MTVVRCSICRRVLKNPVSIAAGVGPVCASKGKGGASVSGQVEIAMSAGEIVVHQANREIQPLTDIERADLAQHEAIIERGLQTFVEVGNALLAIRDGRLYREKWPTFEAYCQCRWGFAGSRARQLIGAAKAMVNLESVTNVTPANEAQVRPLVPLGPEEQRRAWAQAIETAEDAGESLAARHVKQAAAEVREPEPVEYPERVEVFHVAQGETVAREGLGLEDLEAAARDCMAVDVCCIGIKFNSAWASHLVGKVFIVPRHNNRALLNWVKMIVRDYEGDHIKEAVLVVPAWTYTTWWASLRDAVVCLVEGRVDFPREGFSMNPGVAVFYLGPNVKAFHSAFYYLGDVWQRRVLKMASNGAP